MSLRSRRACSYIERNSGCWKRQRATVLRPTPQVFAASPSVEPVAMATQILAAKAGVYLAGRPTGRFGFVRVPWLRGTRGIGKNYTPGSARGSFSLAIIAARIPSARARKRAKTLNDVLMSRLCPQGGAETSVRPAIFHARRDNRFSGRTRRRPDVSRDAAASALQTFSEERLGDDVAPTAGHF